MDEQRQGSTDQGRAKGAKGALKLRWSRKTPPDSPTPASLSPPPPLPDAESQAKETVLASIRRLSDTVHESAFELGGLLHVVRTNKWYGHKSFKDFVEGETCLGYRQACYYIEIHRTVVREKLDWTKFKDVHWTKMRLISKVVTAATADHWYHAATKNSRKALAALVNKGTGHTQSKPKLSTSADDRVSAPDAGMEPSEEARVSDDPPASKLELTMAAAMSKMERPHAVAMLGRLARQFGYRIAPIDDAD